MTAQDIAGLPATGFPAGATPPTPIPRPQPPEDLPRPQVEVPEPRLSDFVPREQRPEPKEEAKVSQESIREAVEELNQVMRGISSRLDFEIYDATDDLFVRVIDRRTNQVIRQMPPQELLDVRARIADAVGLILDEVA